MVTISKFSYENPRYINLLRRRRDKFLRYPFVVFALMAALVLGGCQSRQNDAAQNTEQGSEDAQKEPVSEASSEQPADSESIGRNDYSSVLTEEKVREQLLVPDSTDITIQYGDKTYWKNSFGARGVEVNVYENGNRVAGGFFLVKDGSAGWNLMSYEAPSNEIKKHREGKAVWTYNTKTKCLVISGEGKIAVKDNAMEDEYPDSSEDPRYRPRYYEKVEKIIVQSGITDINEWAFSDYSSLRVIKLPDTVTRIKQYTFWRCKSLRKVVLGSNLKEIDRKAFKNCPSLQDIKFRGNNHSFVLESGILYDRQKTVLYLCPRNKKSVVISPETREIAASAFAHCKYLKNITIPAAVEQIGIDEMGEGAFSECLRLETVTFAPNSRCNAMGDAFFGCKSLREIILPDSVKCVGPDAFRDCDSLRRIYFGSSFGGFGVADETGKAAESRYWMLRNKKLRQILVSRANPRYCSQDGVLYNKNKTKLLYYPRRKKTKTFQIPDTVEIIRASAFMDNCYLEKVIFPESLKRIGYNAFCWGRRLCSVKIVGQDIVIRGSAFSCCQSLSDVTLGEGIREIRSRAFFDNGFKEIYIPPSVVKIGEDAFGVWCERTKLEGGATRIEELDINDFTIYGKKGSEAQRYAKRRIFHFVAVK